LPSLFDDCHRDNGAADVVDSFMALLLLRGFSTPSLLAQGEQRLSSYFNIDRDIPECGAKRLKKGKPSRIWSSSAVGRLIPGGDVVFPISLRAAMALLATRSPHAAERNAGTSFVIRDPGFHFISSGLHFLRSRPLNSIVPTRR
jgi:hypothetical protein